MWLLALLTIIVTSCSELTFWPAQSMNPGLCSLELQVSREVQGRTGADAEGDPCSILLDLAAEIKLSLQFLGNVSENGLHH